MFYSTTIKSVGNTGVVDTQGRYLRFIGDLPVKEGDTVYTDGKYIFGNAPPKGSPAIFDEPSGIPVLGDEDESGKDELRGYFTNRGKYKRYRVKGDEWITNAEKTSAHDGNFEGIDDDNIIDAEIALDDEGNEDGVYTVEKTGDFPQIVSIPHFYGFFQRVSSNPQYSPMNLPQGRIAIDFSERFDAEGFDFHNYFGRIRQFYERQLNTIFVHCSYETGYYDYFERFNVGRGIPLYLCEYFLMERYRVYDLDFIKKDNDVIKPCSLIIKKDGEEIEQIDIAELLKPFEDTAKAEVDPFPDRESIEHIVTLALLHNFKISPDGSWTALLETEIFASNTFYNKTEDRDHSTDPPTINTRPFHISSTASHNHMLLKIKSDSSHEKCWAWKFLYPLHLRDSQFGEYYNGENSVEPDLTAVGDGWFRRIVPGVLVNEEQELYYYEIWMEYYSELSDNGLVYSTPSLEISESFLFPVQDEYQAQCRNRDEDINIWQFGGVYDKDNTRVVGDIFSDEENAHQWNMSLATLKGGGYLFGIHDDPAREIDGELYKIDDKGTAEKVGDGLKNFRLRELKKISKSRR